MTLLEQKRRQTLKKESWESLANFSDKQPKNQAFLISFYNDTCVDNNAAYNFLFQTNVEFIIF